MIGKYSVIVIVAIVGIYLKHLYDQKISWFSLPPGHTYNDKSCELSGLGVGLTGSEDVALGRYGVLFITSGDLHNTFGTGAESANPGGLWVYDMRDGGAQEPVKITLELFPAGRRFQGHGLDVSNTTDRVYSISHNGDHSSVDVFKITYNQECVKNLPWSCSPVTLTYITSITSTLFPNMGINDVIEVENNQVYVTQWQPFAWPARGQKNPENWKERLAVLGQIPVFLLELKLTTVILCTWEEMGEALCESATDIRFQGANGITTDQDRSTVFVNDPLQKTITVMKREKATGKLTKLSEIVMPFGADNIEYDDNSDEIIIGTIPDFMACIKKGKGDDIPVPGGMAIAHKEEGGNGWVVDSVLEHDGAKLAQISAAAKLGSKVVLGSPFSEGILVCKL